MAGIDNILGALQEARKFQMVLNKLGYDFLTSSNPRTVYYRNAVFANLIPPYGAFVKANDDVREMDATLELLGLTYDDVEYPSRTRAFNSVGSFAGSVLNYVSSNVNRLYH